MDMRHHLRFLLLSSLLISLLLIACRNEPKLPPIQEETVVKLRLGGDPESLGFLMVTDSRALEVLHQVFLQLMDFDPVTYELRPVLAKNQPKKTEITEGKYTGTIAFEYEIKDEATWFDGSPVTGNDYLFTLKAMYNPNYNSYYASQFRFVKDVVVDSENSKKFTVYATKYMMSEPSLGAFSPLPAYLYDPTGILKNYSLEELRSDAVKDKEDLKAFAQAFTSPELTRAPEAIRGSGPYYLTSWTTGQELVLEKRKDWWGDKLVNQSPILAAKPSKIIYKVIPDLNAAISLMKNDELDLAGQIAWSSFLDLKKDADFNKKYNFYTPSRFVMRIIRYNAANEKLEDKKVRRAIAHLLDREEVFNTIYYGYPTAISGPIYPTKSSYNKNLKPLDFNIEKAKSLLAEAGWKDSNNNGIVDKVINGTRTELEVSLAFGEGNSDYSNAAAIFQNDAQEAGVSIIPTPMESSAFFKALNSKSFEMVFSGIGDYPFNFDPTTSWHSKSPRNTCSFGTAESDRIIEEITKTIDIGKQDELLKQLQEIIYEEQPAIFICAAKDRIIASKKFGEITTMALSPGYLVNQIAVKQAIPITSSSN